MSIPGAASPLLLATTAAAAADFKIDRSLRFNDDDGAYLDRTPSAVGNRKTWTLSFWVKKHRNGGNAQQIFGQYRADTPEAQNRFQLYFDGSTDKLEIHTFSLTHLKTDRVFRDNSAWYHVVLAVDTTLSTADNRMRLYVNGAEETSFTTRNNPSQNLDLGVNTDGEINIGTAPNAKSSYYADVNLAEINFVEGSQLAASDFGEYDDNNNWNPKAYSGTYGTNGFHLLDFANESTIGHDSSGNNNDFTANNLQSSAGPIYSSGSVSGTLYSGSSWVNVFNGVLPSSLSTTNSAMSYNATGDITLTFPSAISGTIRVYASGASGSLTGTDSKIVLSDSSEITCNVLSSAPQFFSFGSKTNITSITLKQAQNGVRLAGIEVDGSLLVDGNFGDVFRDTPTNADADSGNNIGNYAILNPVDPSTSYQGTYANGNLEFTKTGSNWASAKASIGMTSGKWYCEVTTIDTGTNNIIGVHDETSIQDYLDRDASGYGWRSDGAKVNNNTVGTNIGSYSAGDIMGLAFDADAKALYFYKNNSLAGSFTGITPSYGTYFFAFTQREGKTITVNFGQRPFAYTPPTGYVSLCTQNLTDPTIADGSTAMDVALYTGNGANTNTISGLSMSPDLVWLKRRDSASHHAWYDAVRGAYKHIGSSHTSAEYTESTGRGLSAFNSDGFTIDTSNGEHVGNGSVNVNNATYAAFCWDGGTSTASNTDGSITSNVRANQSAGFSIVTYEADAPNNVIGHGLNAEPYFVITKARDRTDNWLVYHYDLGVNKWLHLNLSSAVITTSGIWGTASNWTSSTFGVSTSSIEGNNYGSHDYVAYCFAPVAGYSAFGSYTGTGTSDNSAPFVFTGFRVRFLLVKNADNTDGWSMWDAARDPDNEVVNKIEPNSSGAEGTNSVHKYDFLSNGFKVRGNWNGFNGSGNTIIYAAFAEHPFKTSRAR